MSSPRRAPFSTPGPASVTSASVGVGGTTLTLGFSSPITGFIGDPEAFELVGLSGTGVGLSADVVAGTLVIVSDTSVPDATFWTYAGPASDFDFSGQPLNTPDPTTAVPFP